MIHLARIRISETNNFSNTYIDYSSISNIFANTIRNINFMCRISTDYHSQTQSYLDS
jgi:hypothetical protein